MNNLRQTGQKSGHRPPACTRRHVWSRVAELGWPGARSILLLQATATVEIRADPTTTGVSQPACGRGGSQSPPSVSFFPVVKSSAHAAALHCTAHHVQLALQLQWSGQVDLRAGFSGKHAWRGGGAYAYRFLPTPPSESLHSHARPVREIV